MLNTIIFGNKDSSIVLIQPVFKEDTSIQNIYEELKHNTSKEFMMIFVEIEDWNRDLSPWVAPSVFGKEDFGDKAKNTLSEILKLCLDTNKQYYLGGYSLGGLFSLWASFNTDKFEGIASVSGSLWFPNFLDYFKNHKILTSNVYLSLGDKESKTKNKVMSNVGKCTEECYKILKEKNIHSYFEWNEGNHFNHPDLRVVKGFKWLLESDENEIYE